MEESRLGKNHSPSKREGTLKEAGGFTLIEIALAVFILAASLTTLIALESAATVRSLDDHNQFRLMLAARQVASHIESRALPLDVTETELPLLQYLEQQQGTQPLAARDLEDLTLNIKVQYWGLPDYDKALKRIDIAIWREVDPELRYEILFFVPNDDEELFEEFDED